MKLVRITHDRCNEYDGTEFVLAPDDWGGERISEEVRVVVEEMIQDAKTVKEPPFGEPRFHTPYEEYPDFTVREAQKQHQQKRAEYETWRKENYHLSRSFVIRLGERGFVQLGDDESAVGVIAHWGHNHGLTFNYEHMKYPD